MSTKVTIEELIKLAQEQGAALNQAVSDNEIERFILALDIKEGKYRVKHAMAYKAYKLWSAAPIGNLSFHNKFSKFFPKFHQNYLLNYRPIELLNSVDNIKIKL